MDSIRFNFYLRRNNGDEMHASRSDTAGEAENATGLRRMFENGGHLGAFEIVPGVRARGLLRQLQEQARHEAFSQDYTSDHEIV
jgi:hypothetical protein